MQKYLLLITTILFLASCGEKPAGTLEEKKALLSSKNTELAALQNEIKLLQEEISKEEPKTEKEALTITAMKVEKTEFKRFIDLQAIVSTDDIVNASSDMGGRITRLLVKVGQIVKKGQLIASVDVESVDKQKDEIQKSLDLAVDVYDRQKRLWEQNIGSEVQYLQAKNNKERLEKSMQTLDVQLRKRNVVAPISGAVDVVYLKAGELAGPGAPIVQILNTSKIKVVTDVPETYLGKIKVGDKVTVQFPALNKEMVKTVSLMGRTIDPSNRTFKMEILMDNANGELKPNLLSIVKVNDYTKKDAIVIPVDNIQQDVSGKKYVYIVKDEGGTPKAHKAYITTGESGSNTIVVTEGLTSGDQIILKGARNVVEGQAVIIEAN